MGKVFWIFNTGEYWIMNIDREKMSFWHCKYLVWLNCIQKVFYKSFAESANKKRTRTGVEDVSQNPAFLKRIAAKSWPWSFRKDNKVKRKTKLEKKGPSACMHTYIPDCLQKRGMTFSTTYMEGTFSFIVAFHYITKVAPIICHV